MRTARIPFVFSRRQSLLVNGRSKSLALHPVVVGLISSGGDHGITLLMKPNKVESAIQYFSMSRASVRRTFGHGNSIHNIIPLLKKENVHL